MNDTLQASINPTQHRTLEPQVEAHFSPSRTVVSCDFQGAICNKEKRLTLSIGSQRNEAKRANFFEVFIKDFYNPPHLIATEMAFWVGVFSKIQSIFTIIPLI